MMTAIPGWTTLAEQPALLVRDYGFGGGRATAMAVKLERGWLMVSPPANIKPGEVEAFRDSGGVVALLENNAAHSMGLAPWRAHFPDAVSYATPVAAKRIAKKSKDAGRLADIPELQALCGDQVHVVVLPACRMGDVLVRVTTEKGDALYLSDLVANLPELPKNPVARLMFKWSDSAPGLKVFMLFFWFFTSDKTAVRDALIAELQAHPPAMLIPAHGNWLVEPELGPRLTTLLRTKLA